MKIPIDPQSTTPPFEHVRAHIAGRIATGDLSPGTKLPTVRGFAAELGLAVNTAARVYRELESDSLIVTHGRGGRSCTAPSPKALQHPRWQHGHATPRTTTRGRLADSDSRGPRRSVLVEQSWSGSPGG